MLRTIAQVAIPRPRVSRVLRLLLFLCLVTAPTFAAGVVAVAPAEWSSTKSARFQEKLVEINGLRFIPTDLLKSSELSVILAADNCPLDATWLPFHDHLLKRRQTHAIVPAGTRVFRGMKAITDVQIAAFFSEGVIAPSVFHYRRAPELHQDDRVVTDLSQHSSVGSANSALVSTSFNFEKAKQFGGPGGIVLEIVLGANRGVNLGLLFGDHSYAHEEEVAVAFTVKAHEIVKIYRLSPDGTIAKIYDAPVRAH